MTLKMAVSSNTSGSGVMKDIPGVSVMSFVQAVRKAADIMSVDMIFFIFRIVVQPTNITKFLLLLSRYETI